MSRSSKERVFSRSSLLVDIGSHSLGIAHVKCTRGGVRISGATRKDFTKESLEVGQIQDRIKDLLPKFLADAREAFGEPNEVVVIVNGMFTVGQTRSEWHNLDQQELTSERTFRPLIQSAITRFFKEVLHAERNDFVALDTSLLCARVNGYDSARPFGQLATSVGATVHVAVMPKDFYSIVEKGISRVFPDTPFSVHSATYALYRAFNDFMDSDHWMFYDATGGILEAAFIENGILQNVGSFPEGAHALTERIASELDVGTKEAHSDLVMFSRGTLERKRSLALRQAMTKALRDYAKEAVPVFTDAHIHAELPCNVMVVAAPATVPVLKAFFEDPLYIEQTVGCDVPTYMWADADWLVERGLRFDDGPKDVFLGVLALGVSRFKSGPLVL